MPPISSRRRHFYVFLGLVTAAWMAGLVAIASTVIPDLYWFSYYSIDYRHGFVRRGLAGQLVRLFPPDQYFSGLQLLRWLPTVVYAAGLAILSWAVAVRSGRSERRTMMALLIPVLPFGFTFALFSARPDLLGAFAFIVFATVIRFADGDRPAVLASLCYGIFVAVIAFVHEATPFLFGLGVLIALVVLGAFRRTEVLRLCAWLALLPGLLASLVIAAFGRRGISQELCRSIPHGTVNWPASGDPTVSQILDGFRFDVDYHDWICRNIVPFYDQSFGDAVKFVADIGPFLLAAATAIGVALFGISLLAISHTAGVPLSRIAEILRARTSWVLVGALLFVPIFMTGVDWIRWWETIALDLGVVFLLYASGQPEADQPVTRRALIIFAIGAALLALFPLGILPGFGAPVPK